MIFATLAGMGLAQNAPVINDDVKEGFENDTDSLVENMKVKIKDDIMAER